MLRKQQNKDKFNEWLAKCLEEHNDKVHHFKMKLFTCSHNIMVKQLIDTWLTCRDLISCLNWVTVFSAITALLWKGKEHVRSYVLYTDIGIIPWESVKTFQP